MPKKTDTIEFLKREARNTAVAKGYQIIEKQSKFDNTKASRVEKKVKEKKIKDMTVDPNPKK